MDTQKSSLKPLTISISSADALDLLATCTGLETLKIDVGLQSLKLESPGAFARHKTRGLRSLTFSGLFLPYLLSFSFQG